MTEQVSPRCTSRRLRPWTLLGDLRTRDGLQLSASVRASLNCAPLSPHYPHSSITDALSWQPLSAAPDTPGVAPDTPGLTPDTPGVASDSPGLAPDAPGVAPEPLGLTSDSPSVAPDPLRLAL